MWAVVFLFGFAFGYYETVYFAIGMDISDPRIAAFMFAVIMAVGNFGIAGGQPLAGMLVDSLGFRVDVPHFCCGSPAGVTVGIRHLQKSPENCLRDSHAHHLN